MTAITWHDNPWDLFPEHRHLGTDGSGNEIVVDMAGGRAGPVFGLWHDPPEVFVLAHSEADLRRTVATDGDFQSEQFAARVERLEAERDVATAYPRATAGARLGAGFADWLAQLPADAVIHDLRQARIRSGFTWGGGTFTRCPDALVFAVVPAAPKPSLWRRLFG